jgi:hypothetical protein
MLWNCSIEARGLLYNDWRQYRIRSRRIRSKLSLFVHPHELYVSISTSAPPNASSLFVGAESFNLKCWNLAWSCGLISSKQRLPTRQHKDGCPGQFWLLPKSSHGSGPWIFCRLSRPRDWLAWLWSCGRATATTARITAVLIILRTCILKQGDITDIPTTRKSVVYRQGEKISTLDNSVLR